jgi:outer membrane lipoprotein carrier protein
MKYNIIGLSILFFLNLNAFGQNEQEAVKILDRFSSNALSAPSVSMKFMLVTTDQMENKNDTLAGSVILSKDKYKLELPDNIVWFNGETSTSYLPAEKEATITKPDKKDHSFQNRPSAIFSLYRNGYRSRFIEERQDSYIIDLYPEDIKTDMVRVRLSIGKNSLDLRTLEYKRKDGIVSTLIIREYNLKIKPDADTFLFHSEKFKDVEIIDMR